MILEMMKLYCERNDPVIFDVGANNGTNTIEFAQAYKHGVVHAFEPDPRAYKSLCINTAILDNIKLSESVVSNCNGLVDFYQSSGKNPFFETSKDWDMSGSIKAPSLHKVIHPWCEFNTTIKVKSITLDDYCFLNKIDFIDLLWMDVQGAELDVFDGAIRMLTSQKIRMIYTEYSDCELYKGAPGLEGIKFKLKQYGCDMLQAAVVDNNVLLINKKASVNDTNNNTIM